VKVQLRTYTARLLVTTFNLRGVMGELSNDRAGLHKGLGILLITLLLSSCTYIPESHWDCTYPDDEGNWSCKSTHADSLGREFFCHDDAYVKPDPCVPEWCDLPIQDCSLPPLTGGTDSCGNPCTKPSPEWPNCIGG
jgi:hypothetical protein